MLNGLIFNLASSLVPYVGPVIKRPDFLLEQTPFLFAIVIGVDRVDRLV